MMLKNTHASAPSTRTPPQSVTKNTHTPASSIDALPTITTGPPLVEERSNRPPELAVQVFESPAVEPRMQLPSVCIHKQVNAFEKKMKDAVLQDRQPGPSLTAGNPRRENVPAARRNGGTSGLARISSGGDDNSVSIGTQIIQSSENQSAPSTKDPKQKARAQTRKKSIKEKHPRKPGKIPNADSTSNNNKPPALAHPKIKKSSSAVNVKIAPKNRHSSSTSSLNSASGPNSQSDTRDGKRRWLANFDLQFGRAMEQFSDTVVDVDGLEYMQQSLRS
jgi:hypothetical protein